MPNHFRFADVASALGMMVKSPCDDMLGESTEVIARQDTQPDEMDAYERVLTDAMGSNATLFAREDYIEEAWRIVDQVLKANTPVYEYEPGTWGPAQAEERVVPPDGWHNPALRPTAATGTAVPAA